MRCRLLLPMCAVSESLSVSLSVTAAQLARLHCAGFIHCSLFQSTLASCYVVQTANGRLVCYQINLNCAVCVDTRSSLSSVHVLHVDSHGEYVRLLNKSFVVSWKFYIFQIVFSLAFKNVGWTSTNIFWTKTQVSRTPSLVITIELSLYGIYQCNPWVTDFNYDNVLQNPPHRP